MTDATRREHPDSRRYLVPIAWTATLLVAVLAGFWAARTTLLPPPPSLQRAEPTLYTVSEGSVGDAIRFTAQADWESIPLARNAAEGIVTSIDIQAGAMVDIGTRLYSVDLRPAFAAEGAVPAFREMAEPMRGADVAQLQSFLTSEGHYTGGIDGAFDSAVTRSVRAWQEAIGVDVSGIVVRGDLVFVPALPSRVMPAEGLVVGASVAVGEPAFEALPTAPTFTITLAPEQADLVPLDARVAIEHAAGSWDGVIASSTMSVDGELLLALTGPDGAPLCGEECASVPVGDPALYTADIVVVPDASGPLVPVSALLTKPDGTVVVVGEGGTELPVTIAAASDGQAVVSGISAGTVIRLFGQDEATPASSSAGP